MENKTQIQSIVKVTKVCIHLANLYQLSQSNQDDDEFLFYRYFTGEDNNCFLLCDRCLEAAKNRLPLALNDPEPDLLANLEKHTKYPNNTGHPKGKFRKSNLRFDHHTVQLVEQIPASLLDLQPMYPNNSEPLWLGITSEGELYSIDLKLGVSEFIMKLPDSKLDLFQPISLLLSPDSKFATVVNTYGSDGLVLNLIQRKVTLYLNRGDYHVENCIFSVAFFEHNDQVYLIHATNWNWLDISDPITGQTLTKRSYTFSTPGDKRPLHYLDYFQGGLVVSPKGKWIVDNGWVWHPIGIITSWNLERWLKENPWESEDGSSRKELLERFYYWDGPLCWMNETTLIIWGEGDDDENLVNSAILLDVVSGKQKGVFAGPPQGRFIFDKYLFVLYKKQLQGSWDILPLPPAWYTLKKNLIDQVPGEHPVSISVWDIESGEGLLFDTTFCPVRYHPGAKVFLTITQNNEFQLSYLIEEGKANPD